MVYVLYGLEEFLIDKEIKNILNSNHIDELSIERYDLENTLLDNIIDSCNINNLFSEKKCIIVNNSYIFTGVVKKNSLEHNTDILDKYLDNIDENCILIFKVLSEKLDERKKIVKKIKNIGKIKEFNSGDNIDSVVKDFFDGYSISSKALNTFINRVGDNLALLENEAEKLKIYKLDSKKIDEEDIISIVNKNIELDIFNLIDNIVLKKKKEALEVYNEMIKYGEEPIKIMIMLASQFRLMLQAKLMYKKGYSEKDMASTLAVHPYRVKLALDKGRKFSENQLIVLLDELSNLDSKVKLSEVDKKMALELFIIKL